LLLLVARSDALEHSALRRLVAANGIAGGDTAGAGTDDRR
jgi:hypothetical protein